MVNLQTITRINTKSKVKSWLGTSGPIGMSAQNITYIQSKQGILNGTNIKDIKDMENEDWVTIGKMALNSGDSIPF